VYVTHDQVEAMTMGDRIAVMKDGLLQQVGTPVELYMHPANLFVAGFIGSPAMNFVTVTASGGELVMGESRMALGGEPARVVAAQGTGKSLTIGFRPEHLKLANGASDGAMRFPAVVDVVEYLGNEELIHARAEGNDIVALLPSDRKVKAGEKVELAVPLEQLFVFDPESEKALVS
jgi:ABC-type sugar transport system ATPase subunit